MKKLFLMLLGFLFLACARVSQEDQFAKAVLAGDVKRVNSFLNAGADPNYIYNGVPVLIIAIGNDYYKCNVEIVETLLKKGANPNTLAQGIGINPISLAVREGCLECVKKLVSSGGRIIEKPKYGVLLAVEAVATGNMDIVNFLYERGVNFNGEENEQTPLMFSAFHNDIEMISFLLSIGVSRCIKDEDGKMASDYALEKNNDKIAKLVKCNKIKDDANEIKDAH